MEMLIVQQHASNFPAFIAIGTGLLIRYIISRRRFNRRGVAGLQLFSSYEKWWFITRIEALFYFLGLLSIIGGIIFIIFK